MYVDTKAANTPEASESGPEHFQVQCFMSYQGDSLGFYDFRAKNLEMGLDLLIALGHRPAMRGCHLEVSITIGVLNYSRQCGAGAALERFLKDAANMFEWEIQ